MSQDLLKIVRRDPVEACLDGHLLLHLRWLAALDCSRLQADSCVHQSPVAGFHRLQNDFELTESRLAYKGLLWL